MKKLTKRSVAILLTLCMVVSMFGTAAVFGASASSFTDINSSHWAYKYVDDVVSKGHFAGTSSTTFGPEVSMTRAMFVTVLSNVEGATVNNNASTVFTDVPSGEWYTGAIAWAAENDIVKGITDTTFEPNTPITREQMASLIVRYADHAKMTLGTSTSAVTFTDEAAISDYAKDAVKACQRAGLISGMGDGTFAPKGTATRAQVAAIISLLEGGPSGVDKDGKYTVTFNSNGGSSVASQKVAEGEKVVKPSNPTRSGYTFDAWYSDKDLKNKYDFNTPVTESLTLYAGWNLSSGGSGGSGGNGGGGGDESAKSEYIDKVEVIKGVMGADASYIDVYIKSNYYVTSIKYDGKEMSQITSADGNVWRYAIYGNFPSDMEKIYELLVVEAEEIITAKSWVGYNSVFGTHAYVYIKDGFTVQSISATGQAGAPNYDSAENKYSVNIPGVTSGKVKVSIVCDKQPLEYSLDVINF